MLNRRDCFRSVEIIAVILFATGQVAAQSYIGIDLYVLQSPPGTSFDFLTGSRQPPPEGKLLATPPVGRSAEVAAVKLRFSGVRHPAMSSTWPRQEAARSSTAPTALTKLEQGERNNRWHSRVALERHRSFRRRFASHEFNRIR